ncbi:MAG: D-alanyl-D-alanine carboxypeptidase [Alphaproteobacteria bacterium]|jgi:D-alanyl-D-alanine carboxypeptidase (penicillin-binding protein 5/6)|nr:D-alanyl-D-alanine carboxypeptidase [Alphaproteobacteria bacterium]
MLRIFFYFLIIAFCSIKLAFSAIPSYEVKVKAAIVVSPETNKILFQKNSEQRISPASLTKLMTIYLIFDSLKKGLISLDTVAIVSENAYKKGNYRTGGSTMFLRKDEHVSVDDLIKGIIVVSGNDASIVMSELIVGTEEEFLNEMNKKARELGLENTNFQNVDGIYNKNHYSTVADLYTLTNRLMQDFPEYYHYFAIQEFTHNGITQKNRNPLLTLTFANNVVVDGLKTGHVDDSKYSLILSSIKDDNFRIVAVLIGANSEIERKIEARKLIDWVYRTFERRVVYHKGEVIKEAPIFNGKQDTLQIIANQDIVVLVPRSMSNDDIKQTLSYKNYYMAPIKKGEKIATLDITAKDSDYNISYDLFAEKDIESSLIISKYLLAPYYAIKKLLGN